VSTYGTSGTERRCWLHKEGTVLLAVSFAAEAIL